MIISDIDYLEFLSGGAPKIEGSKNDKGNVKIKIKINQKAVAQSRGSNNSSTAFNIAIVDINLIQEFLSLT